MKRYNKIILTCAGAALIVGAALTAAAYTIGLPKADLQTETKIIKDTVNVLNINVDYNDIIIRTYDRDDISVSYMYGGTRQYDVSIKDGVLDIAYVFEKPKRQKWYDFISLDFGEHKNSITIEVPKSFSADMNIVNGYGDTNIAGINSKMTLRANYGDLRLSNMRGSLNTDLNYGDIEIKNSEFSSLKCQLDCGDIELGDVESSMDINCDYGDIEFDRISGDSLILNNDCGDIEGTIRGNEADYVLGGKKTLKAETDLGDVEIEFVK